MNRKHIQQFEEEMNWNAPKEFYDYVLEKYASDLTVSDEEISGDLWYEMERYKSGELSFHGKTAKECLLQEQVQQLQKTVGKLNQHFRELDSLFSQWKENCKIESPAKIWLAEQRKKGFMEELHKFVEENEMSQCESDELHLWVAQGHSVFENPSYYSYESGLPMNFLDAYRADEYFAGLSDDERIALFSACNSDSSSDDFFF